MENTIHNAMRPRGHSVDVGMVEKVAQKKAPLYGIDGGFKTIVLERNVAKPLRDDREREILDGQRHRRASLATETIPTRTMRQACAFL